ncbi:MAG TPA: hypothetical protein VJU61_11705, partial [Polyangiaceae bacterium]|nr:hypothetical protein [Polyangiaceae bacterium]
MRRSTGLVAFLGLLAWAACSSDPDVPVDVAASGNQPGDDFLGGDDGLSGRAGNGDSQPSCLGETRAAEAIGLDIYVMLDSSGSMNATVPPRSALEFPISKWNAVRASLNAFVRAPETEGIGVGLQFFPQIEEGVPPTCRTNADCGATGGNCTSSVCVDTTTIALPNGPDPVFISEVDGDGPYCSQDSECGGGQLCREIRGLCVLRPGVNANVPQGDPLPLGVPAFCGSNADCTDLPGTVCEDIGLCEQPLAGQDTLCTQTFTCPAAAGDCVLAGYVCTEQTHCAVEDYATPAVPITSGPTRAADITGALASRIPSSLTPTGPALQGALEHAKLWAADHPDRQVVTVLATDGFPEGLCTPEAIPDIADIAREANLGNQPVRTFVIGVFASADLAQGRRQDLDQIAQAGGSSAAIVINTAGDVTQDFLDALNRIRDTSVSCDFQLTGTSLDFDQVNLEVVDDQGSAELLNVGDASACADDDGWFYQRDASGTPKQIRVCPNTCQRFATGGVTANLQIGCAT